MTQGRLSAFRGRFARADIERNLVGLLLVGLAFVGLQPFGIGSNYLSSVLVMAGIYVLLAIGLNVVVGYAGLLDLGYAGFWAIGAYTTAIVTGAGPWHPIHLAIWWAIPIAVSITVASGLLLGAATLRVRGDYLAIVTLGFGEIIRILANTLNGLTSGPAGITDIPHPVINGFDFGLDPRPYILMLAILIAGATLVISNLWHSRIGRAWFATRTDEQAAEAMGVPTFRMKLFAFSIGAATAGLAGVIYASYVTYITPDNFVILVAILVMAAVVMGGMGRTSGVMLGALAVVILPEIFRDFEQERYLVFGLVLVVMMIVRPQGFLPIRMRRYPARPGGDAALRTALPILMAPTEPVQWAGPASGPIIECKHVGKSFGGLVALDDVTFSVPASKVFAVIGPNGAGKSTLFDAITGVRPPTSGDILLDGRSVLGLPTHRVTEAGIARTFQLIRVFGASSVIENVMVGLDVHSQSNAFDATFRMPRYRRAESAALEHAYALLDFCGIGAYAHEAAANLSYGDQRRVEIARALGTRPRLLMLDEPAAGMNAVEKGRLGDLIAVIRDSGMSVMLIEHDMSLVLDVSDEVLVLDHGVVIAHGDPDGVAVDPQVIEAYLGAEVA